MQLMWLSGPTSQVKKISITARNVLLAALALAASLLLIGFALNWVGLRIAIEYNPDLARKLGGVTTELEQRRMESVYRDRLDQLKTVLDQNIQEVKKLEAIKNHFMGLATPAVLKNSLNLKEESQGGPFISVQLPSYFKVGFFRRSHIDWLEALPIAMPIQSDFRLTSGFGIRNDPFTGALALHEGLDFAAEVGTPVLAAGPGLVIRSGWDAGYGNVIEIRHAENFITRYAHLNKRHVTENMQVNTSTVIGDVGNTGRSTGPHLHYEIFHQGKALNPMHVLLVKAP